MSHIIENSRLSSQISEAYDKVKIYPLLYLPYFLNCLCDKSCNGVNFEFQYDDIILCVALCRQNSCF